MRFYVYELIDPRDGSSFYVGKGQRNRITAHEAEAASGRESRKCARIREIWADGFVVERRRVFETDDEVLAYEREVALIAQIGLDKLTNVSPGGGWLRLSSSPPAVFVWTIGLLSKRASIALRMARAAAQGKPVYALGYDWLPAIRVGLAKM